eukprot:CAMPEP_0114595016 /NCGR_PEP_ID=MMETSP0125-20121206/16731_1 /TAXON_ID=485358 ORGANISM="Aristerostoma sp., Strain ATCC 50986" /NCGR_SAMPLE_ID=MMETSP0125 /ASSEMBLY_ACC=CAM_ASM_000245 /LENGTH=97 /DNA_ID=CAMNT_0001796015 /DNA_START=393 /DNA_END=686 /DNA_ORIENTATION=+
MENPLLIKNKKFDIRQWALISDWDNFVVWFYDECYIRFSVRDYDPENLKNRFSHLTNYSISKKATDFHEQEIEGNMWSSGEFADYLTTLTGKDVFRE